MNNQHSGRRVVLHAQQLFAAYPKLSGEGEEEALTTGVRGASIGE
jgi:hypothetical protein